MRHKGDVAQHYYVAAGPFGGRANEDGHEKLLRVMGEDEDQHGFGVRMTARATVAGPFGKKRRALEILAQIVMACPEYETDQGNLPVWELTEGEVAMVRENMGLT